MITYTVKYVGQIGLMVSVKEDLDGFIWNNSLENHYKFVGNNDSTSWTIEAEPYAVDTILEAFSELEINPTN